MTGKEIRTLREDILRVTREQFATALGVKPQSVYLWEEGTNEPTEANRVILGQMWHLALDPVKAIVLRHAVFDAARLPMAPPASEAEPGTPGGTGMASFALGHLLKTSFGVLPRWPNLTVPDIWVLHKLAWDLDGMGWDTDDLFPGLREGDKRLEAARARFSDLIHLSRLLVVDVDRVLPDHRQAAAVLPVPKTQKLIEQAVRNLDLLQFLYEFCASPEKQALAETYKKRCEEWAVTGQPVTSGTPGKMKSTSKKGTNMNAHNQGPQMGKGGGGGKSGGGRPANGPSTTGRPSGGGRGNNPSK